MVNTSLPHLTLRLTHFHVVVLTTRTGALIRVCLTGCVVCLVSLQLTFLPRPKIACCPFLHLTLLNLGPLLLTPCPRF